MITDEKLKFPDQKGNNPEIRLTDRENYPKDNWRRKYFNIGWVTEHTIENMNECYYTASEEVESCYIRMNNCKSSTIDLKANYNITANCSDYGYISGGERNKVKLNYPDWAYIDDSGRINNEKQYISIKPILDLLKFLGIKVGFTVSAAPEYGSTITQEDVKKRKEIEAQGLVIEY